MAVAIGMLRTAYRLWSAGALHVGMGSALIEDVVLALQIAVVVAFVLLGVAAAVRAPRSGASGWWAAAGLTSLAAALSVLWVPEWLGLEVPSQADDAGFVLLIAFPYLLVRFTATFRDLPRLVEVVAAAAALLAVTVVVAPLPGPDRPYVLAALACWAGVSLISVGTLWGAGAGQPGVLRRRLRLMATAAAVLIAALVTAIELGDNSGAELVACGFALVSAAAFALGLNPPRALRLSWRGEEDAQLRAATVALLRADTVDEVARNLLPPTIRILGGSGAAIVSPDGLVVASHGRAPAAGERLEILDAAAGQAREVASLGEAHGHLVVWTSAYVPFFGPEERAMFQSLSAVAGLALERCALVAEEQRQRAALEAARAQAEHARGEAEVAREAADNANRAKSEFLSRMSHELRTPLNAILGFGQLLEISPLEGEDAEGVGHVLKAGRHLLALVDDILDLSRIEAGALTISLEPVHAGGLIADTITLVRPLAADRSIRITTDEQGCDGYVLTDRQRCRQALLNLLSNAVKYNRDHGTVRVSCEQHDGQTLRIAVRDTGRGIDASRRDRLFEPFERLGAESSAVEGTGLGLALTKQLVERLGGSIDFDSTPGEGSTFWIDLPVTAEPAAPEDTPAVTDRPVVEGSFQLLLVEDNLANLRLVEAMLRRRPGISVLPVMQGAIALDLAYQHRPDLIVLDLHLPDLSGREVLNRLKADPRTRDIPIVIASADATPRRVQQLRDEGAFAYITKPLELQRFLDVVDDALAGPRTAGGQDSEPLDA